MTALVEPTDRQLTRVQLADPEVANQLRLRVRRLAARHEALFGLHAASTAEELARIEATARKLYEMITRPGLTTSAHAPTELARLMRALVDRAELEGPEFWETALGRAMALRDCYPNPIMPRSHAAAILDVSRQRVAQMVALGLLAEGRHGHIATDSLTRLLVAA